MVVGIDLQPLTEQTISEMAYSSHDLWLVKIATITFGPFETESLKHYLSENEHLFENAEATRMDNIEWKSFWENTVFQRRKIQALNGEQHEGPFWIMDMGLKVGPLSFRDVDKKIEMGLLVMTDHISVDDGHSWKKIYEIEGFDRRTYSPDELPIAPLESEFQKAKLVLVEKMEQPRIHVSEELAEMAWSGQQQAKIIQFNVEEMTLQTSKSIEVSDSLKWAVPAAAAVVMTLMTTGYFMFSSEEEPTVAFEETTEEKPFYQASAAPRKTPRGVVPQVPAMRKPASVSYSQTPQNDYREISYPTQMDMHENYEEPIQERDPLDGPVTDAELPPQEHSLVGNENNPAGDSLDAAMNGVNQPAEQQVVDEASDF